MIKLPDLNNKQLMYDSEVNWHFTMTTERIVKLLIHWEVVNMTKHIPGAIVECGVFKGESLIRFAHFRNIIGSNFSSKVIGFDNFDDTYPNTAYEEDQPQREVWMNTAGSSSISVEQLETVFRNRDLSNFEFIAGDICETVPKYVNNHKGLKISILNIDCDFVEPTFTSLAYLYPLVSKGGIILLDNYAGEGENGNSYFGDTKGIDDFLADKNIKIRRFPWAARPCYIIKE